MPRYNYAKYMGQQEGEREEEERRTLGRYNYERYMTSPEPEPSPPALPEPEPAQEPRTRTYTASTGAVITPEDIRTRSEALASLSPREQRRAERELLDPDNPVLKFLKDITIDPLAEVLDYLFYETAPGRFLTRLSQGAAAFSGAPVRPEQQVTTGSQAADVAADILGSVGAVVANPANIGQSFVGAAYTNPATQYLAAQVGSRIANPLASRAAAEATREAIAGAVEGATTSAMRGEDDVLREAALGGLLGAGAGGIIGGVVEPAARRGIETAREALERRRAGEELLELIETAPLEVAPPRTRAVARAELPMTPERQRAEAVAEYYRRRTPPVALPPASAAADAAAIGRMTTPTARRTALAAAETPPATTPEVPPSTAPRTTPETPAPTTRTVPEGVQAMTAAPIPLRAPDPTRTNVQPITRKELIDNIRKRFGVTIRTGRLGSVPRGTLGIHKYTPEVIRTRYANDIQIIAHELGHNLDKRYGLKNEFFLPELENLVRQTGVVNLDAYSPDQILDEGVAEFIRLYLTDPAQAQRLAPRYSRFFETRAQEILPELRATREDVARWIDQGEALQFEGQINRSARSETSIREQWRKFYSSAVDRFYALAVAEKEITGKLDDASRSLYKKARLSVGAPAKAQLVLEDLQRILSQLRGTGWTVKDLGNYAAARHALDLENLGIESGFTRKQIEATLRKYQSPEMDAIQQQLVAYNNRLLDMLVEGQILSREARDAMVRKYPNYVPFFRYFDEDVDAVGFKPGAGKGFADLTNPIKRMKGSTRDIIDPIESMIRNTFAVVNAVEKNKVGLELARLANMEGAGRWVERLEGATSVPRENIVTVFENGQRVQYQLDPELYRAMKQLDEESSSMLVRILSTPASWLRAGATLTPEFMLRNPIRDQFQAFVVSEFGYNPIIDLPRGMFHVLRKRLTGVDEMYDAWIRAGGGYGNFVSLDRNVLREQLRELYDERNPWMRRMIAIVNPKDWLKLLRAMSEISEEATKVGEFARGIRQGATPEEAAYQSRDLMDFGRRGAHMKQANQMIAFLNSTIQGKDRIARAFINHPTRTTVRALTAITIPTIAIYVWNRFNANETQRETLDNAPQWMKDTFFLIAVPGTDVVARIPKPFDLSPVFSSIPENIMRWMDDNDPQTMDEFAETLGRDWAIPVLFTALTPWIENQSNYSWFTGGPIIPRRDQDLLPEDQYGPQTSLTARVVGRATNYSPYLIDNLIRGYGGGLGRYATAGLDELLEFLGVGQLPPEPARRLSESPLLSPFTVGTMGGGKVMDDFYELLDELSRQDQSNKKNNIRDPFVSSSAKMLRSAASDISELRRRYREIQESFDLTPEEKRKRLDELNKRMRQIARQTINRVEERGRQQQQQAR